MSVFDQLKKSSRQMTDEQQYQAMQQDVRSIMANPAEYLKQRGYDIPAGMNDPRAITRHLLSNGQIGTNRLQQVMRMIGFPGRR